MARFSKAVAALSALTSAYAQFPNMSALTSAYAQFSNEVVSFSNMPYSQFSHEDVGKAEEGPYYVFLQKFPLEGSFLGLTVYHTEVLVCPAGGFTAVETTWLSDTIGKMTDFAEVPHWESVTASCVELGYGGDGCTTECCSVGKKVMPLNKRQAVITNADVSKKSVFIYGTGTFDGETAYHHACDKKCWSDFRGTDYSILTCNCNTFTSVVLNSVYGLSEKKPDLGVSDMVNVKGSCPAQSDATAIVV